MVLHFKAFCLKVPISLWAHQVENVHTFSAESLCKHSIHFEVYVKLAWQHLRLAGFEHAHLSDVVTRTREAKWRTWAQNNAIASLRPLVGQKTAYRKVQDSILRQPDDDKKVWNL